MSVLLARPLDLSHLIDKPLQHFEPLLEHRPEDLDYLQRVGGELRAVIEALLPKTAPVWLVVMVIITVAHSSG
jgi:hypothetical protein